MGGEGGNEPLQDLGPLLSMTRPRRWRILFWSPSPTLLAPESFVMVEPSVQGLACSREPPWGQGQSRGLWQWAKGRQRRGHNSRDHGDGSFAQEAINGPAI